MSSPHISKKSGLGGAFIAGFLFCACNATPNVSNTDGGTVIAADSGVPTNYSLAMHDVSILLPLPTSLDGPRFLLSAVLPQTTFDGIPAFKGSPPAKLADWIVVGVRIDPCFPTLRFFVDDPSRCRQQLRIVAQPIALNTQSIETSDSAIHLLFDLTPTEFSKLLDAFASFHHESQDGAKLPLNIHPTLKEEGLGGQLSQQLQATVLTYAKPSNLREIAVSLGKNIFWNFSAFSFEQTVMKPLAISGVVPAEGLSEFSQSYNTLASKDFFDMTPTSPLADSLEPLAGFRAGELGGTWKLTANESTVRQALQSSLEIDNPSTGHHAKSVDCATCHIATRARERALSLGYSVQGLTRYQNDRFDLSPSVDVATLQDGKNVRAFGYHGRQPSITQRTINESAAVAEVLSARLSN